MFEDRVSGRSKEKREEKRRDIENRIEESEIEVLYHYVFAPLLIVFLDSVTLILRKSHSIRSMNLCIKLLFFSLLLCSSLLSSSFLFCSLLIAFLDSATLIQQKERKKKSREKKKKEKGNKRSLFLCRNFFSYL